MHFLDTDDVTHLYPRPEDFRSLRRRLDPKGRFLDDHLWVRRVRAVNSRYWNQAAFDY